MGPTRFPFGQAWGFANQFYTNKGVGGVAAGLQVAGTAGDISGQTAPDVTIGGLFYTNNTAALTLTNFVLQDTANRLAQYEGKVIRVFFLDTATQIANAGALVLQGTDNLIGANNQIELMFSRGSWFETDRVRLNRTEVNNYTIGSAGSINVDGVRVAIVTGTAATSVVFAFSGGQVGQEITLMNNGSSGVNTFVSTGGNIAFITTNLYAINASGAYKFIKKNNTTWLMLHIGSTGIANV